MQKGNIILLNGVSSAGKSTLARCLQDKLTTAYYHICCDDFMHMTPRQILHDDFDNQLNITQGVMHETIRLFSDRGCHTVVDDVILDLPDKNDWFYDYCTMFDGYPLLLVRVDCPVHELERREVQRGDRSIGQARWQSEHMDEAITYDLVFDTYERTTDQCAEEIICLLAQLERWRALRDNKCRIEKLRE